MRKGMAAFLCLAIIYMAIPVASMEVIRSGRELLEDILATYSGKEAILSDQLQIVQDNVNFRKTPGGDVLGRLHGGTILDCIDETQYKGELWYHARSADYGEGYVICTFAKPIWDNLNFWPLPEKEDIISDNMVLFAAWMGAYQLDHGLSIIDSDGAERHLSIAPLTVRGNMSVVPEDMKIQLVMKLFEYGFLCRNNAYYKLLNETISLEQKNGIASSLLMKHYGTDDIWKIITGSSIVLFIHVNDLHARPEGPMSGRDSKLMDAVQRKIIEEHE